MQQSGAWTEINRLILKNPVPGIIRCIREQGLVLG